MTASRHLSSRLRALRQRRRIVVLVAALLAALVLAAGFYLGQRAANSGTGLGTDTFRVVRVELTAARERIVSLQAEVDVQRTWHAVDRQALEIVRREIAAQKKQVASLEEGLRFYKGLMASEEIARGLSVRPIELVARDAPGHYAYRIVAQQEARKHTPLRGELYVEVFGVLAEQQVSYPLADLSDDLEEQVVALRFRYFQTIEGELTLPEGFEPRGVSLVASASTPRKKEVRERFPWHLQESFTHVGK